MRACLLGLACFAALFSTPVVAQDSENFTLGGVRLELGAPEAVVRRQLEEHHTITSGGFVITKGGPPFSSVGSVTFKDGKLAWATKSWDENLDQSASVDVVRRVIAMVGNRRGCVTTTVNEAEPTFRRSALIIRCPSFRQIEVSVGEPPGTNRQFVNVTEYYGPR
jgi:hypothetical protein